MTQTVLYCKLAKPKKWGALVLSFRSSSRVCAKGQAICIPSNYSKFDLPNETLTVVHVGIDIKDIPKIDDQEYSITLNAFFVVRWTDKRMIIDKEKMDQVGDA